MIEYVFARVSVSTGLPHYTWSSEPAYAKQKPPFPTQHTDQGQRSYRSHNYERTQYCLVDDFSSLINF